MNTRGLIFHVLVAGATIVGAQARGAAVKNSAANDKSAPFTPSVHVSGYVEMPGTNGTKVDLSKEDLVLKTAQVSIAKGARVNGILTFVLSKTSENSVSNNNTSLSVHFKDSQSSPYQTPKSVIGGKAKPISNPTPKAD